MTQDACKAANAARSQLACLLPAKSAAARRQEAAAAAAAAVTLLQVSLLLLQLIRRGREYSTFV